MRNRNQKGFTLIELLIVIAIIGILAAVLIPNLLTARERAFDTAAQTCLKEIAAQEEIAASQPDWEYLDGTLAGVAETPHSNGIAACANVLVSDERVDDTDLFDFAYEANHVNGSSVYAIKAGGGVTRVGDIP